MENIFGVTEFLRDVIRREGGDPIVRHWSIIEERRDVFLKMMKEIWRCANFIANLKYQDGGASGAVLPVSQKLWSFFSSWVSIRQRVFARRSRISTIR